MRLSLITHLFDAYYQVPFNFVSIAGLYLPTILRVLSFSQFVYLHTYAYDWLLTNLGSTFYFLLTFLVVFTFFQHTPAMFMIS